MKGEKLTAASGRIPARAGPAARKLPLFALALTLALVLALTVPATLALFIAKPSGAENTITPGYADVDVVEEEWDKQGDEIEVSPGGPPVSKDPAVKNNNSIPVFVRMLVTGGVKNFKYIVGTGGEVEFEALPVGGDNSSWQKGTGGDEYFYYKKILEPEQTTTTLFDAVKLKSEFTGGADNLDIIVYAEAVQTIGENGEEFKTVQDAFEAITAVDN
jgi:hypothetical protein